MKNIVVGVCGGIAAYKVAEIVNDLVKKGNQVHVIMTESAEKFIGPLTLQTLSKNPVIRDMFSEKDKAEVLHISLAQKAHVFLLVPATANVIGKVANGIADDMLTTTIMAAKCRKIIAPAMNTAMWENPIVQDNLDKLRKYGYEVLETDSGRLACGDLGAGKLLPWQDIVAAVIEEE